MLYIISKKIKTEEKQNNMRMILIIILLFVIGEKMDFFIELFNQDYISNIFIGITGILVAIVIFIAEIIKDQKNELSRRVILKKTKIRRTVIYILIVFMYMLICNIFKYNKEYEILNITNLIYIITHCILLILVIIAIIKTGKMFWLTLKLNTEKDYFYKELEKYVDKKVIQLEKKANNKCKKKLKDEKKEFKAFIENQEIYFNQETEEKLKENYYPIYPAKNGILKKYKYDKLIELSNLYIEQKVNAPEYSEKNCKIVYISNKIGKKIDKETVIFYCLKNNLNIFKNINELVVYEDNRMYINDEIELINKALFEMALDYNEPDDFDENNRLYNYFDYLYKNNLYGIKQLAMNSIEEMAKKVHKIFSKNRQFCGFLNRIAKLAYDNNDYENYKYINNLILYLYNYQLEIENTDSKNVVYNFANNIIRYSLFSLKRNKDIRYYDYLMSILFRFLINLIKEVKYDEIDVLLNNITMERMNYRNNELDDYDVIKFQFCCGIIYSFIVLSKQDKQEELYYENIKRILKYFNNDFIKVYDTWKIISYFKKYFNMETCVQRVYDHLEFYFIDHKYKNNWGGYGIGERTILKELIYIFNINFIRKETIDLDEIKKEDKYYYQDLLELIKTESKTNLEKYLNINYDNQDLIEALEYVLVYAKEKEKEYNRVHKLNREKVNEFKKNIIEGIEKENEFIKLLKKYDKIGKSEEKLKEVYGINQLIPREIFFEDVGGHNMLAEDYSNTLKNGLKREYVKKIMELSKKSEMTIEDEIKKIDNPTEYLIITNYIKSDFLEKYEYNFQTSMVKINNKEIQVVKISSIEGMFLIKLNDLPKIKFCKYDDEWNQECISNSVFYDFVDLSEDEKLRKKFIENAEWIKEKGTSKDQDNYLKECCRVRLYLSYKIIVNEGENFLKLDLSNNE